MAFGNGIELGSSTVLSAAYDERASQLRIQFRGGRSYVYEGVPRSVFDWLLRVPNKGAYVSRMVVGCYPERRVDERTPAPQPGDLEAALMASLERLAADDQ